MVPAIRNILWRGFRVKQTHGLRHFGPNISQAGRSEPQA
jgi:hypothetical protein